MCRGREKTKSTTPGYFMNIQKKGSMLVTISRVQTEVLHLEEGHRAIMPRCHHYLSWRMKLHCHQFSIGKTFLVCRKAGAHLQYRPDSLKKKNNNHLCWIKRHLLFMLQDLKPCDEVLGSMRWGEHTQPVQGDAPVQIQAELSSLSICI